MVIGLTERQWASLMRVADPEGWLLRVLDSLGLEAGTAEQRYTHRDLATAVLRPWL
jgi:hypothetical protein